METSLVAVLVQCGALGLLFILILRVPGWLKTINEARAAEQGVNVRERADLLLAWREEQALVRQAFVTALNGQTASLAGKLDSVRHAVERSCRHPSPMPPTTSGEKQ